MKQEKQTGKVPIHRRIVFWILMPVLIVGTAISGVLISGLTPRMNAFLNEEFEANLRLASKLGIGICESHFSRLLDMRLEENREMNAAFMKEALAQIKAIDRDMANVHLLVLEAGRHIRMISIPCDQTEWHPPAGPGNRDAVVDATLAGDTVKTHTRYFPFWDWHIISFVKETTYLAPITAARQIIYLSTIGVLAAVFITLLLVFYLAVDKPVKTLIAATENVAKGKMHPVRPVRKNEIGRLMVFFNHMVESLKKKSAEVNELIGRLTASEERYKSLVELFPDAVIVCRDGVIRYINPSGTRIFGAENAQALTGKPLEDLVHPGSKEEARADINAVLSDRITLPPRELQYLRIDGRVIDAEVTGTYIDYAGGPAFLGVVRDITDRKQTENSLRESEERLRQAQRMESVGKLAGGIAHDFNNMLGIILGNTEIMLEDIPPGNPLATNLGEIQRAASRSADLTRQLLAFARKQTITPRVLDLNKTVTGMLKMLKRLIGEDIELSWHPGADLWPVWMDPSQVDQILANLCVNARDAITGAGKITIDTGNVQFDQARPMDRTEIRPGDYVRIAVADTGCGMDEETRDNVFEPFFTTKDVGEGTGLGLATVYGIVKQNRGFIDVESSPAGGTRIAIYLPRYAGEYGGHEKPDVSEKAVSGSEVVLVVEDEKAILQMTATMLQRLGYKVIPALFPSEAVRIAESRADTIDLLITDVVMPEMSGRELYDRLATAIPHLKCLFMSGYTESVIARHGVLEEGVYFIHKPFGINEFAAKIRQVLDTGGDNL